MRKHEWMNERTMMNEDIIFSRSVLTRKKCGRVTYFHSQRFSLFLSNPCFIVVWKMACWNSKQCSNSNILRNGLRSGRFGIELSLILALRKIIMLFLFVYQSQIISLHSLLKHTVRFHSFNESQAENWISFHVQKIQTYLPRVLVPCWYWS